MDFNFNFGEPITSIVFAFNGDVKLLVLETRVLVMSVTFKTLKDLKTPETLHLCDVFVPQRYLKNGGSGLNDMLDVAVNDVQVRVADF